jgi:hypothetical protein
MNEAQTLPLTPDCQDEAMTAAPPLGGGVVIWGGRTPIRFAAEGGISFCLCGSAHRLKQSSVAKVQVLHGAR